MTSLLLQLADRGVTGIRVEYSGGGDSGCIDSINYVTQKLSQNEAEAFDTINYEPSWTNADALSLMNLDSGIYSDLEDFAQDRILNSIEDWWNNEGGYGVMSIIVPSGKYKIENNIYITSTEEYCHEGSLIDQSLN